LEEKDRDNCLVRSAIRVSAPLHRWLYRTCGSRVGGNWATDRMPALLADHNGKAHRQGADLAGGVHTRRRCLRDRRLVRGLASHPGWYHNLSAGPRVVIEVGGGRLRRQAAPTGDRARQAVG